jgi:cytochrome c oxidase subunit I+III
MATTAGFTETNVVLARDDRELKRSWAEPRGLIGWLTEDDHKAIGIRFMATAFVFFILGGLQALLIRLQLAQPMADIVGPDFYNQLFTMHGTTMMFFFAVPMLEGVGIYLVPLMIGARDNAFPRLNSFSYFTYLFAGVILYGGFLIGQGPNMGWFSYTPLADKPFSPGRGVDVWALPVTMLEFSALTQALTLIVTILKCRAPGMTLARMPIFVWAFLVMSSLVVVAMPSLITTTVLLELDRAFDTQFFRPAGGGDPLLWQHLFWWFGHPEVYIIFLPAFGFIAAILPTFTRREIVGHDFVVLAVVAVGLISVSVWAHHMFAVGLPWLSLAFFSAMTFAVAIPTGIQIFAWLATVWSAPRLSFETPFLFSIGFVLIFVIGGLTGVMLASAPFNFQATDTHFVVAHFHYVLIGGMVFPLFAAFYYWWPKVTGRMLSETMGKWSFWLAFIGFNVAFLPMHVTGLIGMPRRVYTYQPGMGLEIPNLISTIGAFVFAASVLVLIVNAVWSMRRGEPAGDDPWGAGTLEWAVSSPPPDYNFRHTPSVRSRSPLWVQPEFANRTPLPPGHGLPDRPDEAFYAELREDRREILATTVAEAIPDARIVSPGPSIWPFLTAASTALAIGGILLSAWMLVAGAALAFLTLCFWHWPAQSGGRPGLVPAAPPNILALTPPERRRSILDLPDHVSGTRNVMWWGMALFLGILSLVFALLIFSYFYLQGRSPQWPPGGIALPSPTVPTIYTGLLLASAAAMMYARRVAGDELRAPLFLALLAAILLAAMHLGLKAYEFAEIIRYSWVDNAYASLNWLISWLHAALVLTVILNCAALLPLVWSGHFKADRTSGIEVLGLFWGFTALVWIPLFVVLYLSPGWR